MYSVGIFEPAALSEIVVDHITRGAAGLPEQTQAPLTVSQCPAGAGMRHLTKDCFALQSKRASLTTMLQSV